MTTTDLFIPNKYCKIYYHIVTRAKDRIAKGYIEKHHIIPKSTGSNDGNENIVRLTASEHFVCRWLLKKKLTNANKAYWSDRKLKETTK